VADIPSQEIKLPMKKGAPEHAYFLIGPKKGAKTPKYGYGLLLVLPGGDGGRGFHPFVKRIYKNAIGADMIVAQPIAVAWERSKMIVWPTKKTTGLGAVPPTEDFMEAVVTDVAQRVKVNPARVYLLAWSSSGPAAYAASLQKYKSVTGSFIAMSVFKPAYLPPVKEAKGEAYVIYHSPDDAVCPYRMAEEAAQVLKKSGAKVAFMTYAGGHGWRGDLYGAMRKGIAFLEKNRARPSKKVWAARKKRRKKS
jgi:predicted esterase